MIVLALDPGRKTTGVCRYDTIDELVITSISELANESVQWELAHADAVACEWIEHYGAFITAGADVFHTCRWIGRFEEQAFCAKVPFHLVTRRDVKLHLCGSMRAKDAQVRQALLDRFGGTDRAKGTKRSPGPLYGVAGHAWSALALAITFSDDHARQPSVKAIE